jgi:hypothetical protein
MSASDRNYTERFSIVLLRGWEGGMRRAIPGGRAFREYISFIVERVRRKMDSQGSESGVIAVIRAELFRINGAVERDPAIDAWMKEHRGELGETAREWFEAMRKCGDEVRETMHDGCPVACLGDAAFGYVNVFASHVNVGFFQGAVLPDPARLLEGSGKFMRHVKLRPGKASDGAALRGLVEAAYLDIKARVENG